MTEIRVGNEEKNGTMDKLDKVATFPETAADTACMWVAKLDRGDLSSADSRKLREWISQDPAHREAFARQLREWGDMDVLRELSYLGLEEQQRTRKGWIPGTWLASRPAAYVGGAIALALVALFLGRNHIEPYTAVLPAANLNVVDMKINTSVGEKHTESLPDGSVVHVNTVSAADIAYSRRERAIHLHAGEAYFDVSSEEDRPFVVYAAGTRVTAMGTAFSVYLYDGTVKVAVTQGAVEFTSADTTTIVAAIPEDSNGELAGSAAGNVAVYSGQHTTVDIQPDDVLARSLSWQDGMLEFRGETLEYAVDQLSRYTEARIVIIDDDIKDVRVGGYFKIGDIEGLASTLELGFNVRLEVVSDKLIQLSRADGKSRPPT